MISGADRPAPCLLCRDILHNVGAVSESERELIIHAPLILSSFYLFGYMHERDHGSPSKEFFIQSNKWICIALQNLIHESSKWRSKTVMAETADHGARTDIPSACLCYYACVHVYLSLSLCLKCSQQAVWYSLTVDWEEESPLCRTRAGKALQLVKCVHVCVCVCVCVCVHVWTRGASTTCYTCMYATIQCCSVQQQQHE